MLKNKLFMIVALLLTGQMHSAATQVTSNAAAYLCQQQTPSGFFKYEFDFVTQAYTPQNNVTRQAGTAYGLSEYLKATNDAGLFPCIKKSLNELEARAIPYKKGLVSSLKGTAHTTSTGATALALLATLFYLDAKQDNALIRLKDKWVNGLRGLYISNKGFRSTTMNEKESDYYNGEAWLALAHYVARHPQDKETRALLKALDTYLMKYYKMHPTKAFYHWGMMAAAQRYDMTHHQTFLDFMVHQTTWILSQDSKVRMLVNNCYLLEGLLSVYPHLPEGDLKKRVKERITAEMPKLKTFQIQKKQTHLTLGKKHLLYSPKLSQFSGAFINGKKRPQARIDFTQHCLSAFVKYEKLFGKDYPCNASK